MYGVRLSGFDMMLLAAEFVMAVRQERKLTRLSIAEAV
jgi:hypothetical protein